LPQNTNIIYHDLGPIDFKQAWDYQEKLFKEIVDIKVENLRASEEERKETPNYLLFCEHSHVYTLGKSGSETNLLINNIQLKQKDASFYRINRGGDITYHGPGQIVGYPILDLENFNLSVRKYIYLLEEAIILTLQAYDINSERLEGATGVWLDTNEPQKTRKICAIGVRSSRWITMHGFAFNINTNLEYFNHINPCGFTDKPVTSLEKETGQRNDIVGVKEILKNNIASLFGMHLA